MHETNERIYEPPERARSTRGSYTEAATRLARALELEHPQEDFFHVDTD
jgi:hypothetical protein